MKISDLIKYKIEISQQWFGSINRNPMPVCKVPGPWYKYEFCTNHATYILSKHPDGYRYCVLLPLIICTTTNIEWKDL